jgi:MtrB/PioB family decaheme-associated outer membrane protein
MVLTIHPEHASSVRRHSTPVKKGIAFATKPPSGRAAAVFLASTLAAHGAASADTVQGDALNPRGIDPTRERDRSGMSLLIPEPSRTPSGLLFEPPVEVRQAMPFTGNWNYRLTTELGVLRGPDRAPRIRDYGDFRDGFRWNYLDFSTEQAGTARYFDFTAGAVGRKDQHYRAIFGGYGDFKTSIYFSQIPKQFTDQAHTLFQGIGSGNLTLPAGLVPGNNTAAQITAALQAASPFALGFDRKKAGLDFDATPGAEWRFHARYSQEQKKGTRPFGSASSYPGVPAVETIEPVDYKTHDLSAGLQWSSETYQANFGYTGSFFRNAIDTLTWENPLTVGDPAVVQRGRMDLYPDNGFHNLKLDLSAALPMRGRLSGGLSWSRMTQDNNLIAPTVNSGILAGTNLANWNTPDALSQKSAGARIDTRLAHASGAFSPLQDLSLQVRLRHIEEDNKTRYAAFNPLTGQLGYFGLDGGNNSNIVPGVFRVPIQSVPFETRKNNYSIEGDYQLRRRTNVILEYAREGIRDPYREYGKTTEDRFRAALNNRDVPWATVRVSYEHARREGDDYRFDPNRLFYSGTALINAPATLADLGKYDVADRKQQVLKGRAVFMVAGDMDLAVSGRYTQNKYGATYGRLSDQLTAFNLEWNWQPHPGASAYAHYGYERRHNRMAQISDDPAGWGTGNPNAGGAVYPLANRWEQESRDNAHTLGLGIRYAFAGATLESGYAYLYSPSLILYRFASDGALVGGAAAAATAGEGMPNINFRQQSLETSLRITINKNMALRLYHRYERTRIEDWHYDGLPLVFSNGAGVFLGAGPRNYSGNLFGVFYQYTPAAREK